MSSGQPNPSRRWDTDTKGRGVASGEPFVRDLDRLATEMSDSAWIAEQPEAHLLPHLRSAIEERKNGWRLIAARMEDDGRYVAELAAAPNLSFRQTRQELFAIIGSIAELSTHVRERRIDDRTEYEIATGMLEGDRGWRAHGHIVVFRLVQG